MKDRGSLTPQNRKCSTALGLAFLLVLLAACEQAAPPPSARAASTVCNLNQGPCEGVSSWGPFSVAVSPHPVPVLTPVSVELRFRAPAGADATIDLSGAEMDMGPNQVRLQRLDSALRQGQFVIPICLTGSMRWRLTVTLHENGRSESIAYEFIAPTAHATRTTGPS